MVSDAKVNMLSSLKVILGSFNLDRMPEVLVEAQAMVALVICQNRISKVAELATKVRSLPQLH